MTFSAKALRPLRICVLLFAQPLSRVLALIRPEQLFIVLILLFIVILRLLPTSYFFTIDRFLGRSGDGILLLVAVMLAAGSLLLKRFRDDDAKGHHKLSSTIPEPVVAILDMHLQLDNEIDHKLTEVIEDTETSALLIITNVRQLYDTASNLVAYLEKSSLKGSALETEISNSVAFIVDIGSFIEKMPAKIERDLKNVQSIVNEIKELSGLVQAVHNIGMQSHLLAINAAIEATRAGSSGAAFRVVADEMRSLASNSNGVATKINDGLSRARYVVEHGMAASLSESSQQLGQISMAVTAVKGLQDNFEDISQYYKTRFTVVTKHNENLTKDIADALGQIQYQDVVRQCVERIRFAIGQRNEYLKSTVDRISDGDDDLSLLPALLEMIRVDYLTEEEKHKHSARHTVGDGSELKIELF